MDKPRKPGAAWDPRRVPLHRRIRNRREELGLTAAQLADMVEVSASYISLIENGEKVPGEDVAVRIAQALRDDPGLYVAWTQTTRHEDPARQLRDLTWLHTLSSDPAKRERLESGQDLEEEEDEDPLESLDLFMERPAMLRAQPDEEAEEEGCAAEPEADNAWNAMTLGSPEMKSALHEVDEAVRHEKRLVGMVGESTYSGVIRIPVLEDGADPGDDPATSEAVIDLVLFDPRALPLQTTGRLFAYRPGRPFLRRVENLIKPGDLVILSSRIGRLAPDRIHAVRRDGEILLSRVLYKRNALLLLPAEDSARIEVIDLPGREALPGIIAGSVVTTVRAWGRKGAAADTRSVSTWTIPDRGLVMRGYGRLRRSRPDRKATTTRLPGERPRWRAAELRGRHLVRDCEWKPRYGWRPVQRAADLDFLEENPEIKVRFRLLRDGELRYVLEMDADEWREALGDYADGPTWRRNGYIVPVTKMRDREYTEEFKERWAPYVTRAG